ncbi:MAG: LON peptidase substrate-binding domain-containing protein, partial [Deltaproteobacteria bacterium]|nr:LON peptidase substrate-binding domain-containing protein [Deltaproteobacteria bacterium]
MTDQEKSHQEPEKAGAEVSTANGLQSEPEKTELPSILPLLAMSELNLFPRMIHPIIIFDVKLMAVVQDSIPKSRFIALFPLKEGVEAPQNPLVTDLREMGVAAFVLQMSRSDDGPMRVLVQGLQRIRLEEILHDEPYLTARISVVPEILSMDKEVEALTASIRGLFKKVLDLSPNLPDELKLMNQNIDHPGLLADVVSSSLNLKKEEKHDLIATIDVKQRLERVVFFLERQLEILELGSKIQSQVKG